MTTREYCRQLLEDVEVAGRDPELAYMVRTRLRRSVIALERGRYGDAHGLLHNAPPEIRRLTMRLGSRALSLCQPSEALDLRWKREWAGLLRDVERLRLWTETG